MIAQRVLGTAAVAAMTFWAAAQAVAQSFPTDDEIRAILQERIDQGRGEGLVVGLLEADGSQRVVFAGSAGPDARPLGDQTLFEIGSITKAFTGALLAEMARRGEVDLADPVAGYLPDGTSVPSRGGREITLLDLATHRSALPRLPGNMPFGDPTNPYADYTAEHLYAFLSGHELSREIGARVEYSNLGMGLLGHALALAAGTSYEEALRARILDPLGLRNTTIALAGEAPEWMARGHDQAGGVVPLWDLPTLAGAGALRSNVLDMLRWLDANMGEPTSDLERALRQAHEPREVLTTTPVDLRVGLGWITRLDGDARIVWHNGGTAGFFSFAGFDPDRRVGVVVLGNSQHPVDDIALHLFDPASPLTEPARGVTPEDRVEVDVPDEILREYVGEYQLAPAFFIMITFEDGALHLQATGQPRVPIFPASESTFFLRVVDAQITFQRDEDGTVSGLVLEQAGQRIPGRKVN
jgi:serine-type D-Ala-D-Ala carboxypeptidase/endopeptidase